MEKYFKLLHLNSDATLIDVKKAYRMFAKKNHPDRFMDEKQKVRQGKIMVRLNEAYKALLTYFKTLKDDVNQPAQKENVKFETENDINLYKKGVSFFNLYSGSLSIRKPGYTKFDKESIEEKALNLKKAQSCFLRLLEKHPESDWAYDAQERLKRIEKIIIPLTQKSSGNGPLLPKKDSEFYETKFKNIFYKYRT